MTPPAAMVADPVDDVFRALADATRRGVLARLGRSPASVSELAEPYDMALPSFVQHLRVLEGCGLVRSEKVGRVRTYQLEPARLRLAEDWLAEQRAFWERRLDQLDDYLITLKEQNPCRRSPRSTPIPALDLVLQREVDVPTELVWAAWTEPEHVTKWFTPLPWTTTDCEIDLRPGGIFRTVMRSPEGEEFDNVGCYLEVVPHERLVWTDALLPGFRPAPEPFFTGCLTFEPRGDRTLYTAVAIHGDRHPRTATRRWASTTAGPRPSTNSSPTAAPCDGRREARRVRLRSRARCRASVFFPTQGAAWPSVSTTTGAWGGRGMRKIFSSTTMRAIVGVGFILLATACLPSFGGNLERWWPSPGAARTSA